MPDFTPQFITITGARENNLKDVSLDIPKDRITVFVGVSGSGKSSIVFDTVAGDTPPSAATSFRVGRRPKDLRLTSITSMIHC